MTSGTEMTAACHAKVGKYRVIEDFDCRGQEANEVFRLRHDAARVSDAIPSRVGAPDLGKRILTLCYPHG